MNKLLIILIVTLITVPLIVLIVLKIQNIDYFSSAKKELSFQEEASDKIGNIAFPAFLKCVTTDPNSCIRTGEIISIRDNIDILNFAYFPLKNDVITYNKINPDSTLKQMTTSDPIIVILYYSAEMYTIIGSIGDAVSSRQSDPVLEKYRDTLFNEVNKLFKNPNMTKDVTWVDYFKYPGPYGTVWGTKTVDWTLDIKDIDPNYTGDIKNSVYLNSSYNYPLVTDRQQNSQFWQDFIPPQNISVLDGLRQLVKIQCNTIIKRYNNLLKTDENGDWDKSILKESGENIDIYHRLRKSIRSTSRTIENFPEILNTFDKNVPDDFMKFIKTFNMDVPNNPVFQAPTPITFKDIILNKPPLYIVGYLFFVNDDKSDFFRLSKLTKTEYNSLRSLIYFKSIGTGTKSPLLLAIKNGQTGILPSFFKDTIFCPSVSRVPPMKDEIANINNVPNRIYTYQSPNFSNNNFNGSYCEIDDFMGDIHDYSVLYQKNLNNLQYRNVKELEKYVKTGATAIKNMFKDINFIEVVNNLKNGLDD